MSARSRAWPENAVEPCPWVGLGAAHVAVSLVGAADEGALLP